jgi:protein phosphatase
MADLTIPDQSLVALIGISGSGKSTFARTHFAPTQVLSSDWFRGMVSDDEGDQAATTDAFDALFYVAGKRLAAGRVTVVDATNVQRESRAALVKLARQHHVLPTAIVLDLPESVCAARNARRPDREFGSHVLRRQRADLRRSLSSLGREGFRRVHVLRTQEEIDSARIVVEPLLNDRRADTGPFDVIGDVHGCRAELEELLGELGYRIARDDRGRAVGASHPRGRRVVFVGDLVDRGPDTPGVLRLAMGMVEAGTALVVCGNHEQKLARALAGRKVQVTHGLAESLEQLAAEPEEFRDAVAGFCDGLVAHYVLDGGRLVVAHAGLPQRFHGRASAGVRAFALYGDTTGETDEFGLPVRYPWAREYRGSAMVLYGHTPVPEAEWVNGTLCLDTGCVFGGRLTALRYPERELVGVAAHRVWYRSTRPLLPAADLPPAAAGRAEPDLLELADVAGKRVVETTSGGRVTVRAEQAAAAMEVMSRFALDPRWLLYLPPTMAPCATSERDGLLEHPDQAFAAYRADGVAQVVCEEKHMGSRAVLLVCRQPDTAARRFGVDGPGAVHTRTGRPFFSATLNAALLERVAAAATKAGLWDELDTDWLLLDAELMPWSAKAADLVRTQYASVAAAATAALPAAVDVLRATIARRPPAPSTTGPAAGSATVAATGSVAASVAGSVAGAGAADGADGGADPLVELLAAAEARAANAEAFRAAYRRYCWPTDVLDGVRLAPFQVLATEGHAHHERDHGWHLAVGARLADADPDLITATRHLVVDTTSPESLAEGVRWWEDLTSAGGEGMVVKPLANGRAGRVQPGVKVRGREYLRIIYGPDYTEPANLTRLRDRGLGTKRSLALREYALGIEALQRLARDEPLWRIHECVFAVLALESQPVDPRL